MLEKIMFGAEIKTPELGAGLFLVSCKKYSVLFGGNSYVCLFKEYAAYVVA